MSKTYILFNPYSNNVCNEDMLKTIEVINQENAIFVDVTKISNYDMFFAELKNDDIIYICGGDGTLNHFINHIRGIDIKNDVYYYPTGTGNDFYYDVYQGSEIKPLLINEYLTNLPIVTVKNNEYYFINGVGYGIDGYCCEEGDRLRELSDKPINYTAIAIKGLLFKYKPTNAKIIVDGKEYNFKKVWIAATMKGRMYGGGMIATPNQKRNSNETSVLVFHGSGKLKTLMIFPSIFKGEHIKKTKNVSILTGKEISVAFDEPRPLQIDGETIKEVSEYKVKSQ